MFSAGFPIPEVKAGPVTALGERGGDCRAPGLKSVGTFGPLTPAGVGLTWLAVLGGLVGPYGVNRRFLVISTPVLIPAFLIILFLRVGLRSLMRNKSLDSFASANTSMSCSADFLIPDSLPLPDFARSSIWSRMSSSSSSSASDSLRILLNSFSRESRPEETASCRPLLCVAVRLSVCK